MEVWRVQGAGDSLPIYAKSSFGGERLPSFFSSRIRLSKTHRHYIQSISTSSTTNTQRVQTVSFCKGFTELYNSSAILRQQCLPISQLSNNRSWLLRQCLPSRIKSRLNSLWVHLGISLSLASFYWYLIIKRIWLTFGCEIPDRCGSNGRQFRWSSTPWRRGGWMQLLLLWMRRAVLLEREYIFDNKCIVDYRSGIWEGTLNSKDLIHLWDSGNSVFMFLVQPFVCSFLCEVSPIRFSWGSLLQDDRPVSIPTSKYSLIFSSWLFSSAFLCLYKSSRGPAGGRSASVRIENYKRKDSTLQRSIYSLRSNGSNKCICESATFLMRQGRVSWPPSRVIIAGKMFELGREDLVSYPAGAQYNYDFTHYWFGIKFKTSDLEIVIMNIHI